MKRVASLAATLAVVFFILFGFTLPIRAAHAVPNIYGATIDFCNSCADQESPTNELGLVTFENNTFACLSKVKQDLAQSVKKTKKKCKGLSGKKKKKCKNKLKKKLFVNFF